MKISRKWNCTHVLIRWASSDFRSRKLSLKTEKITLKNSIAWNYRFKSSDIVTRAQGESTKVALVVICVLSSSLFWKSPWKVYVRASLSQFAITGNSHILADKDAPNEEFASSVHLHGMVASCTGYKPVVSATFVMRFLKRRRRRWRMVRGNPGEGRKSAGTDLRNF